MAKIGKLGLRSISVRNQNSKREKKIGLIQRLWLKLKAEVRFFAFMRERERRRHGGSKIQREESVTWRIATTG